MGTSTPVQLAGISGSLRKGSFNTMLLKETLALLPENVTMELAGIAELPLYNADLDMPQSANRPPAVEVFMDTLRRAQGIVIVSPEYNYSIPGGLKNALDWASRGADSPLLRKPVALMGATPGLWGTVRMQLAFQPLFTYLDMRPVSRPEVLISHAPQQFDTTGRLVNDKTRELVREKLANLVTLIRTGTY